MQQANLGRSLAGNLGSFVSKLSKRDPPSLIGEVAWHIEASCGGKTLTSTTKPTRENPKWSATFTLYVPKHTAIYFSILIRLTPGSEKAHTSTDEVQFHLKAGTQPSASASVKVSDIYYEALKKTTSWDMTLALHPVAKALIAVPAHSQLCVRFSLDKAEETSPDEEVLEAK